MSFRNEYSSLYGLGYGKSDILSKVERAVKQCVCFHKEKFMTASSRRTITASREQEGEADKGKRNGSDLSSVGFNQGSILFQHHG